MRLDLRFIIPTAQGDTFNIVTMGAVVMQAPVTNTAVLSELIIPAMNLQRNAKLSRSMVIYRTENQSSQSSPEVQLFSHFRFYTSTKSWRGYVFTSVCLCVCLSVCVSGSFLVKKIPAERINRFGRGLH